MELFRGYVRTRNKKSVDQFKEGCTLRKLEDVEGYTQYGGVLAKDTVLIDCDDMVSSEKLLKAVTTLKIKCVVRKTDRGMHFFFKNNGDECFKNCKGHKVLAIGIQVDVKTGLKPSYAILKSDGKDRPIIYDAGEVEPVPKFLNVINSTVDFLNMDDGSGRNNKLFAHLLPLTRDEGFTKDEAILTARVINDFIFDKPLSKNEFETIVRDEAFDIPKELNFFSKKNGFMFHEFAQYIVDLLNVKKINGQLHSYEDGAYIHGLNRIEAKMIEVIPKLSRSQRKETLDYIDLLCTKDTLMSDARYIAFNNGIYDVESDELLEFDPKYIVTNKINYNYCENAHDELVDRTLDKLACNRKEIRALLEECAGYCFYKRNELRKAFIFTGDKSNGKSTYIAMLQQMLGQNNTCALDIRELSDRFKTAEMYQKLACLGDDIGDDFLKDMSIFKKLVSGDAVSAERKGEHPFSFCSFAKLIFSANSLPRTKDRTGAVLDRLIVIPFNATFSKSDADYDPYIKYKLLEDNCIEYLIKLGVAGLRRVLEKKSFTESQDVRKELDNYNKLNNPIQFFFEELTAEELTRESLDYWFSQYHEFCLSENINTMGKIEFSRQLLREFNELEIKRKMVDRQTFKRLCFKK